MRMDQDDANALQFWPAAASNAASARFDCRPARYCATGTSFALWDAFISRSDTGEED
jgi:hypothetical protein